MYQMRHGSGDLQFKSRTVKPTSFSTRLNKCLQQADLTIMDLRHWFDRPYPTVSSWVLKGRKPRGPAGREAHKRLEILESCIARGWSVPASAGERARSAYVVEVRDHVMSDPAVLGDGASN